MERSGLPGTIDWDLFGRRLLAAYKRRGSVARLGAEMRIQSRQRLHQMMSTWLERKTRPVFPDGRHVGARASRVIDQMFDRHGADADAFVDDLLYEFLFDTNNKLGKRTLIEVIAWMTGRPTPIPRRDKTRYLK